MQRRQHLQLRWAWALRLRCWKSGYQRRRRPTRCRSASAQLQQLLVSMQWQRRQQQ